MLDLGDDFLKKKQTRIALELAHGQVQTIVAIILIKHERYMLKVFTNIYNKSILFVLIVLIYFIG